MAHRSRWRWPSRWTRTVTSVTPEGPEVGEALCCRPTTQPTLWDRWNKIKSISYAVFGPWRRSRDIDAAWVYRQRQCGKHLYLLDIWPHLWLFPLLLYLLFVLLQVYDPSAAYLGPPVFYAPQAYATIPGQFRFPPAKTHVGGRGLIRTPSVRGEDQRTLITSWK